MTDIDKLLARIGTARDAIGRKAEQTSLDYMIEGVLMECSVLLKEQGETIKGLEDTIRQLNQHIKDLSEYMTPYGTVKGIKAYVESLKEQKPVRCKDCKHGEKANDVYLCGKSRGFGIAHEPDFFCADGERR